MDNNSSMIDILNAFIDNTPEPELDREYFEIEEEYKKLFGHPVPGAMIPDSISSEQIKDAMRTCIEKNEDNLFQLLGVEIDDSVKY